MLDSRGTLVLLDIDGTLVSGGPAKEAFETAMLAIYETRGRIDGFDFSGKTDPQIARELLLDQDWSNEEIDERLPELWARYVTELETRLEDDPMRLLPGVEELLARLEARPDVALGLLTGNIVAGARLKLASVGLAERLSLGGFGSDHEDRDRLAPVAIARAEEAWGVRFAPQRVVVVGDTPRDVACGRIAGTRTVAVATGRCDARALVEAGADRVFDDLTDTDEVELALTGSVTGRGESNTLASGTRSDLLVRRNIDVHSGWESHVGSKEQQEKKHGGDGSMTSFYWVLGVVAVIAVGSVVYSLTRKGFSSLALEAIEVEFENPQELVAMAKGVERGQPDAPITIMEFGDFQCPACRQFATSVKPELDLAYVNEGIAKFVFYDFPLTQHPYAFLASRAARCALDQGGDHYWPYHDQLFLNQASWSANSVPPVAAFGSIAQGLGLNEEEFDQCLNSDQHAATVSASVQLGKELRVNVTPSIFVTKGGGMATRVNQWSNFSSFQEIIDGLLAEDEGTGDAN